jgi:hypothetical protein
VKRQILKGNEKLRAVYANAASALTVQFDELETGGKKPLEGAKSGLTSRLALPEAERKKPP